jgi:tetratricopeptide (TPR) repeat protein
MPFGTVPVPVDGDERSVEIDFDRVYAELFAPALKRADCDPFRADMEVSAGDIRTDMFFELVTADIVVADLSLANPNVYYELGIRDAVSPRGVFILQGGFIKGHAFDVAPDRNFKYDGRLFASNARATIGDVQNAARVRVELDRLTQIFTQAIASDSQVVASPLYSHLPGLKPVNWEGIETSRARHFGALQSDWEECVRTAQAQQRPGNIITLAQDAPTRLHRTKILAHAARALMGLCRFSAAEEVLTEIVRLTPEDAQAQLQLGVVLAELGDTQRAEHQMRSLLDRTDDPKAIQVLGYVYRVLWYLQWKNDPNPRERAKQSSRLLISAIRSFYDAHRRHPEEYLSGYNALLLIHILKDLFPSLKDVHVTPPFVDCDALAGVVHYVATSARENAEVTGDYDTQFWSSVALSGLAMLRGDEESMMQGVRDACAVPSATLFYLQSFQQRMELLDRIHFSPGTVGRALAIVNEAIQSMARKKWTRVVFFFGCPVQAAESFPVSNAPNIKSRIASELRQWNVGPDDLAICSCSTPADILFAETCLDAGPSLRILMLDAIPESNARLLNLYWANRLSDVLEHIPAPEIWYHTKELGEPVDPASAKDRHHRWVINTARMEAEGATNPVTLHVLLLLDGAERHEETGDLSELIADVRAALQFKGRMTIIDPRSLPAADAMNAAS